ncbi:lipoyl(octanoyl) transferase LipB [Frigoribacterium sp. PhB24]|uniref:lipoyl(octanoyl) transferase LipB n=1 Tax=Frigoribacterium sp. PhB24 TaxID=2485204 RepID=UPI000F49E045|nr:lipoyl(octanoyl) transferase LipB [Frigoribacterium sp. PhB24]ROS54799.1 lipoyl(octanoyl) transferase [Frigoribacterium sp. PhB24]
MTTTRRLGVTGAPLDYDEGRRLQRELHADVVAGRLDSALVLCQHPSVYTAGTRTRQADLPRDGSPVVPVDRGGRITWHGPGQLVAYPIVRLPEPLDVVAHVRALEACLIEVCGGVGVPAVRVAGRSGAWVRGPVVDEKVAAVGVRVAEGVTMHGVALNCDADLTPFAQIVPCGITDAGVTSLTRASGRRVAVTDVADALETALTTYLTDLETAGRAPTRPDPVGAHR